MVIPKGERFRLNGVVGAAIVVPLTGFLIAISAQVAPAPAKPGLLPGAAFQQLQSGTPVLDVTQGAFGARGDGVNDDTTAINSALRAAFQSAGGTVYFPCGRTYRINSQIVIPTNRIPSQPVIRLTGCGAGLDSGSILNLAYAGGPKIVTQGAGNLEVDHLLLEDTEDGTHPLIYSPTTRVTIHDNTFLGKRQANPLQDAIVLGPPVMVGTGGFHGYGSVVRENTFSFIGTAVRLQAATNGLVIESNNIVGSCGGVAPFISVGDPASANHGAWIAGNVIEMNNYRYAFQASNTNGGFTLIANNLYDPNTRVTRAYYRFESSATGNLIIPGIQPVESGEVSLSEGSPGTNALIIPYRNNNEEMSRFLSGASLPSLALGGSQVLTGVQGQGGSRVAAASGSFTPGNAIVTDGQGDLVDSNVPSSKTLRNCGTVRFNGATATLTCTWVTPSSACSIVARDRTGLVQGATAFTPSVGAVSLAATTPGNGSFSVACSAN